MSAKRVFPWAAAVLCAAAGNVLAVNGTGVYVTWHHPWIQENEWEGALQRGPIVKATIQNNRVTRRDTIFADVGQYPALSFDGKRVAFFRWGVRQTFDGRYHHNVAGTESAPNYLSVVNTDGTGLANLVQVATIGVSGGDREEGLLDWPAGDWIYYEKPTKTAEIWRINSRDPSKNEFICRYGEPGINVRFWQLSIDAKSAGCQTRGGTNPWYLGGACEFPLVNNSASQSNAIGIAGCNQSVSCKGNFVASYLGGNHEIMFVTCWDHGGVRGLEYGTEWSDCQVHWNEMGQWLGEPLVVAGMGGADQIRWSTNSEKWTIRRICFCYQGIGAEGTNAVAVNWIDKQAINMSQNPAPAACGASAYPSRCACAGDLWIDFGPGNENKWEDVNGLLHTQLPVDPVGYTPQFASVTVTPGISAVAPGQTVPFRATAVDQLGMPLSAQPSFTWSAESGVVTQAGSFTAPATRGGPYTVTATAVVGGTQKSCAVDISVEPVSNGLDYTYTKAGGTDGLNAKSRGAPDLRYWPVDRTGTVANFDEMASGGGDEIGLHFRGLIDIPADGEYTFFVNADDAATLFVDDTEVAATTYQLGEHSGQITLRAGLHPIRLDFIQGCCGIDLNVQWQGPGISKQAVPNNRLFRAGDAATQRIVGDRRATASLVVVRARGTGYVLTVNAPGRHSVEILDASGCVVRRLAGDQASCHVVVEAALAPGMYLARVQVAGTLSTSRIMVR